MLFALARKSKPLASMNVGCVPVDERVIQLKFEHEVAQAILNGGARFISTVSAGRENA